MVGIVHPCKIYNILTIGVAVLYFGPHPSHLTDIMETGNGKPDAKAVEPHSAVGLHYGRARHGDVQAVVQHIERFRKFVRNENR